MALRRLVIRSTRSLRRSPLLEAAVPPLDLSRDNGCLLVPTIDPIPLRPPLISRAFLCSRPLQIDEPSGTAPVDYSSIMPEDEFHRLADTTIHDLLDKFEEYGDSIQVDGFDIDYGNQVLTLKIGSMGTYVINKQTPNRQIWLSSPVSGPARFDWDETSKAWVYRRTKANLLRLLEDEVGRLCEQPVALS